MTRSERLEVRKTYKLYVAGAFPRSESGRSHPVHDSAGAFLANATTASRKDARDAVRAARAAFGGWSRRTAYNRGQVVYRIAEVLEGRRAQLAEEVRRSEGLYRTGAEAAVDDGVPGDQDRVAPRRRVSHLQARLLVVAGPRARPSPGCAAGPGHL
jgi:hypothetical protein